MIFRTIDLKKEKTLRRFQDCVKTMPPALKTYLGLARSPQLFAEGQTVWARPPIMAIRPLLVSNPSVHLWLLESDRNKRTLDRIIDLMMAKLGFIPGKRTKMTEINGYKTGRQYVKLNGSNT